MDIHQIVKRLIGPIHPAGDPSIIDGGRFENLKAMTKLVTRLVTDIDDVAMKENSPEFSVKQAMEIKEVYKIMQAEWVKLHDIKVGDKVKCMRHFIGMELGSDCFGSKNDTNKYGFINDGAIGTIAEIRGRYIEVDLGTNYAGLWSFPFFVLEIVEKVKPENMIMVKGMPWSEDTIELALKQYASDG